MTDEAVKLAVPAITLGYAVKNDPDGKFMFWNEDIQIAYRCGEWVVQDFDYVDPDRHYPTLLDALEQES